jgi:hypothetical protein
MPQNYQKILTVKEFLGLNNVLPPERIPPGEKAFLTVAQNLDIDNSRKGTLRGGYADPTYSGSGIHSMFSYLDVVLFVEGADLKRLNPDYSDDIIHENAGDARMNYVGVQDRIYYTNDSIIEYYDRKLRQAVAFIPPTQTYKILMPPGHLIEWYMGRLLVARDGELWGSDPMAPHQTDSRRGFKQMGGYLTMVRAVQDGLYVSNGDKTYWMPGEFTEMSRITIDEHSAVLGTDIRVDGEFVGKGFPGWVIVWLTKTGITVGAKEGKLVKMTKDFYRPELEYSGAAMVRKIVKSEIADQQFFQYVVAQNIMPDVIVDAAAVPLTDTGSLTATLNIA